ncbi:positive regulation of sphingomyelin catabolic process, partial [Pristimantis euphronides]
MEDSTTRFIAGELICGVQFLHQNAILHRDLKPANILLSGDGHLKVTDFGLSATGFKKNIKKWCAGTPGFAAPEVVYYRPHGPSADYFAIGVIIYQLSTNRLPFPGVDFRAYRESLNCQARFPDFFSPDLKDVIQGLMCKCATQRLGVRGEVRKHPYFDSVDWEEMEAGRAEP